MGLRPKKLNSPSDDDFPFSSVYIDNSSFWLSKYIFTVFVLLEAQRDIIAL